MLPVYNVLTERQVRDIHEAALRVVAEAGVALDHPRAQEALAGAGARISDDRKRVFLPAEVVEKMLARAPREFLCAARDPKNDLVMKLGATYVRQGGGPFAFYDLRNAGTRPLTLRDAIDSVRLINALPHINAPSTVTPQDIDQATYDVAAVKTVLENTRKHFWALTTGADHLKYELELAAATVGGRENLKKRPLLSGVFCVIAPLRFPADEIDRLILCGEYGVNVMTPLTILMGGSAPYTMAGCLTQMTAEFLAAVSIAQALCPGLGQWYYTLFQYLDMRTGRSLTHSPELMLLGAAGAQMSAFYGLPSLANTLLSGDCQPHQVILQYGLNILLGLLNGVTFQVGAGSLDTGNLYCHQSLVIIDEILDYLKFFRQGLDVNPETLAVDDILAAADKGEYISSKLTLKYLRREKRHAPDIMTFPPLANWLKEPDTLIDRAEAKVRRLLAEAPDEPVLPPETLRELDRIMAAAARELGGG
ncbi:MAG: trimethylamine methyltransferase family protein [Candidatus Adiutrix sp.]|jgi:trimethylamine--corrinoid protein Co-methyltransferase|nr:trimethylamine methyltransferase family protein [Candidatus Adiutrix sp.]